jgi:hypothetical protein
MYALCLDLIKVVNRQFLSVINDSLVLILKFHGRIFCDTGVSEAQSNRYVQVMAALVLKYFPINQPRLQTLR